MRKFDIRRKVDVHLNINYGDYRRNFFWSTLSLSGWFLRCVGDQEVIRNACRVLQRAYRRLVISLIASAPRGHHALSVRHCVYVLLKSCIPLPINTPTRTQNNLLQEQHAEMDSQHSSIANTRYWILKVEDNQHQRYVRCWANNPPVASLLLAFGNLQPSRIQLYKYSQIFTYFI